MRGTEIIADLHLTDVEAAKGFYTDCLGPTAVEFNLGWVARCTAPDSGINYSGFQPAGEEAECGLVGARAQASHASRSSRSWLPTTQRFGIGSRWR